MSYSEYSPLPILKNRSLVFLHSGVAKEVSVLIIIFAFIGYNFNL
ncbi:hypothetical protein SPBRAN_1715 [uncultured Candidatus Thioglobus sp.]|nr:hypothetical protein SPBRAN_1715 [uncultured Candidatus Thioglobus sp.]